MFSHQKAGHRAGRLLSYLSDFLSLVSLVALCLACLGSGYLFNSYIVNKTSDIAILLCIGSSKNNAILTYLIQLTILSITACIPAICAVFLLIPLVTEAIEGLIPGSVNVFINYQTVLLAFIVSIFAGCLLGAPSLKKSRA